MKVFRIQTRKGWFSQPEKIAGYQFPMNLGASFQGATVYFGKLSATKAIKFYQLQNCHVEEFEE